MRPTASAATLPMLTPHTTRNHHWNTTTNVWTEKATSIPRLILLIVDVTCPTEE